MLLMFIALSFVCAFVIWAICRVGSREMIVVPDDKDLRHYGTMDEYPE